MLRLRSWASSMISVSYWRSIRSPVSSASRMPSVISLTSVCLADVVGEPDLPADRAAELGAQLLGDPGGHRARGQPARLGVPDHAAHPAAELQADLGQLGGLPGAGLPGDDHHLVVADRRGDVGAPGADRQLLRVADRRHGRGPGGDGALGGRRPPRRCRPSARSRAAPWRVRAAVSSRRASRCSSRSARPGRRAVSASIVGQAGPRARGVGRVGRSSAERRDRVGRGGAAEGTGLAGPEPGPGCGRAGAPAALRDRCAAVREPAAGAGGPSPPRAGATGRPRRESPGDGAAGEDIVLPVSLNGEPGWRQATAHTGR